MGSESSPKIVMLTKARSVRDPRGRIAGGGFTGVVHISEMQNLLAGSMRWIPT